MIAKFVALVCLFGLARAGGWHGSSLGYGSGFGYGHGGYSTYLSPAYTTPVVTKAIYAAPIAPVVTKAVIPAYSYASYAPAISTVSRYDVHSSPIVKSYVAAPIVKSYVPAISSYSAYGSPYGHGYNTGYTGYIGGYSGYGYGGYGSKYLW